MSDKDVLFPTLRKGEPRVGRDPYRAIVDLSSDQGFEEQRIASLLNLERFVRDVDAPMTSLARQAASVCGSPIGLVSFMEEYQQRVIGSFGLEVERVDRRETICTHTILQPDVLIVEDTSLDPRFRDLPSVVGNPHVRFYAGAPIFDSIGLPVGTVCAVDTHPRDLSSRSLYALQRLASLTGAVLEARRLFFSTREAKMPVKEREQVEADLDALLLTLVEPRATSN